MDYAVLLTITGAVCVGIVAWLIKLLAPAPKPTPAQVAGLVLLWAVWGGLLLLPHILDGWAMHGLESGYGGFILVAVFLLLIPVLLVSTGLHAHYLWRCLRR